MPRMALPASMVDFASNFMLETDILRYNNKCGEQKLSLLSKGGSVFNSG